MPCALSHLLNQQNQLFPVSSEAGGYIMKISLCNSVWVCLPNEISFAFISSGWLINISYREAIAAQCDSTQLHHPRQLVTLPIHPYFSQKDIKISD